MADQLRVVPADQSTWADLEAVFGTRGVGSRCFCQRYKLARGEAFTTFPDAGLGQVSRPTQRRAVMRIDF